MKLVLIYIFLLLTVSCSFFSSKGKNLSITPSKSLTIPDLEASIDDLNWQYDGTEERPVIAATIEELSRLKTAWNSSGENHRIIEEFILQTDNEIANGVKFPPEGGQHNQWYQCDSCQRGLETVDAHHHICSECKKIYSGFPFDNVLYSRQHRKNFNIAENAAWAWKITGALKYAEFAAYILSEYASQYNTYQMIHASVNSRNIDVAAQKNSRFKSAGHIMSQTLDEANLLISAATAYDLIYGSNAANDNEMKQIENNLLRAMAGCINFNKAGKSNWQAWHNAALLYAGAAIGDKQMVKQSILDNKNGFMAQMEMSVLPEGMWYENSWGYHYYTLHAMTIIAEGCRRIGIDLYSLEMLKKMYLISFDYQMADGSLPRFGDAVQDSPIVPYINEKAYAAYKDKRLLASLSSEMTWDRILSGREEIRKDNSINLTSKLITGAGHAILATDGPGKLTTAVTFGPYGGFHGHYDKLSFVFFGFGQELGVDPGRAASQAYRLPIHKDWYKATTGHNTILVDGMPQKEAEGQLMAYEATPSYAAVSADAGPVFDNVIHRRFLLLSPFYLLVIDELIATDGLEHTFDWLYHNKGHNISCSLPVSGTEVGKMPSGYAYLSDVEAMKLTNEKHITVNFLNDKVTTWLKMIGRSGDDVFTATGPLSGITDRVPVLIVRRKGQKVHFVTILEPVETDLQPMVTELSLVDSDPMSISVILRGGEDRISFTGESLECFSVTKKTDISEPKVVLKSELNIIK